MNVENGVIYMIHEDTKAPLSKLTAMLMKGGATAGSPLCIRHCNLLSHVTFTWTMCPSLLSNLKFSAKIGVLSRNMTAMQQNGRQATPTNVIHIQYTVTNTT